MKEEGGQGYVIIIRPKYIMTVAKLEDVPKEVQTLLNKYQDIVVDELPSSLSPIRDVSHHIDFIQGENLPNKSAYKMTPQQNEEIRKQIQEFLDKGRIRESLSPCVVPTMLAPRKGGDWRMCIDSREINKITISYRFPIPRIEDLMDCLGGACYFLKIDLNMAIIRLG